LALKILICHCGTFVAVLDNFGFNVNFYTAPLSLAAQCIVIGPVCDWYLQRAGGRAGGVC